MAKEKQSFSEQTNQLKKQYHLPEKILHKITLQSQILIPSFAKADQHPIFKLRRS